MTRVAIGAVMKQEAPYILEWVAYHRALGFELIIADNGGNDETSKILTALHNNRIITRIDVRFLKKKPQIPAYRLILKNACKQQFDIIGFLDCDEFFTRDVPVTTLSPEVGANHIVNEFSRLNATQISYHWLLYGSRTEKTDCTFPVLERFSYHSNPETKENKMVKSFVQVQEMFKISNLFLFTLKIVNSHNFHGASRRWFIDDELIDKYDLHKLIISHNNGAILHYMIKTKEEYLNKVIRGRAVSKKIRYDEKFFEEYDLNDIFTPINPMVITCLNIAIDKLKVILGDYSDITIARNKFRDFWLTLSSSGYSDVTNHKLIFAAYKIIRKLRNIKMY